MAILPAAEPSTDDLEPTVENGPMRRPGQHTREVLRTATPTRGSFHSSPKALSWSRVETRANGRSTILPPAPCVLISYSGGVGRTGALARDLAAAPGETPEPFASRSTIDWTKSERGGLRGAGWRTASRRSPSTVRHCRCDASVRSRTYWDIMSGACRADGDRHFGFLGTVLLGDALFLEVVQVELAKLKSAFCPNAHSVLDHEACQFIAIDQD